MVAQRLGRRDREHAGAGTEIEHAARAACLEHGIEQQEASARGAVVAGTERQRRFDLDTELVGCHPRAVMVAMHDEPSGGDWDEILEAGLDPILGLDSVEADPLCDGLAGGLADDLTDQRLVRRVGKMHGDIPAPVRPLEGGDRGRVFQERALGEGLGEDVDHAFGGLFAADRNAGTVGGGGEG